MLWAVSNALREEAMKANHELFRPCMSVLFKACQKLWLKKVATLPQEGSTSENMFALVKQFTSYTINQLSRDPTAEHMAMVCGNIVKIAESQSESSEKSELDKKTKDELKSIKSSPIRPDEINEQPSSDVGNVCSFNEVVVVNSSTDSPLNVSSPTHSKQSSTSKKCWKKNLPVKLNIAAKKLSHDIRIVLTPLRITKDCKVASNPQNTKVVSCSNSSESPIKGVCQTPEQVRRLTRSKSGEFSEVLSVTKENTNNIFENSEAQTLIVSRIKHSTVCHEEPSKKEENIDKIVGSNRIYTPSKNNEKCSTQNRDSPNTFSRITRRKSHELMELNVASENFEIKLSDPLNENTKSPQNISHTKNIKVLNNEDKKNPQYPYKSPGSSKKYTFKERRKPKSLNKNVLCVNESGSLALSSQCIDNVETNFILTSCTTQESKSPEKVPENALDTSVPLLFNECATNIESESFNSPTNNQPLKSILCKPLGRTLRSISKDSPVKSVSLNENDTVNYNVSSNFLSKQKTDKSTMPKRRKLSTNTTTELSMQKNSLIESVCEEIVMSPVIVDFNEIENSCSQECTDSNLDRRQDCEKDKENKENRVMANSCYSEKKLEAGNTSTSPVKRFPVLTPISQLLPGGTFNRTLQLYNLSNNGDIQPHIVFGERQPPVLVPHWEHQLEPTTR